MQDHTTSNLKGGALLSLFAIGAAATFALATAVHASGISAGEVIRLVNEERSDVGIATLKENSILAQAAEAKARDMIKNDYFAHTSPSGKTPWYWMKQAGYQYRTAGENLAVNYSNAKEQHRAWMKSATHRANILNTKYREIGVAVVEGKIDGENSIVTVQMFGTPLAAVADKTMPVTPPTTAPVPTVQGLEETESAELFPAGIPAIVPAETKETEPPAPTQAAPLSQSDAALARTLEIALVATLAMVALTLALSPLVFLLQTSLVLWSLWGREKVDQTMKKLPEPAKMLAAPPEKKMLV